MFSVTCWGQTTAFEGDVKGEDGKPLVKVIVHLDRKDIKGTYKVNTDKKGHYYYGGLPIGTYKIWVEVDGKERDSVDNVKSGLGDAKVISFDLKKSATSAADRQAEMQKVLASGGELTKEQTRDMTPEQKAALEKKMKDAAATMAKNKALNDAFNAGKGALDKAGADTDAAEKAKDYDAAIENLEKAKTMAPDQNVVWGNLADAYAGAAKAKTGADQQALLDKGIESYKKAIELKPDDAAYHNNYALLLAQSKKADEALVELTKAAQLDPPNAGKYYFNGGAVLVNLGQNEPAGAMFKKAIEADPTYADAHYQYGIYLIGKATTTSDGKIVPPAGTKEEFEKYLELRPDGANAEASKAMLTSMGETLQTDYSKPGSKKPTTATKKKP
ncbi:MAG TPA: carboxypeptidase regulatory-like domain-containing protein [Bryobacteraceae bacterium]|nr:carboxypeptidase regulatory-like domain-containing protein [Bryobacteraceae bacterium]